MDIGYDSHITPALEQALLDQLQVLGVFYRRGGDPHDFATDLHQVQSLLNTGLCIHGVASQHGLDPNRVATANADVADPNFACKPPVIHPRIRTVGWMLHWFSEGAGWAG